MHTPGLIARTSDDEMSDNAICDLRLAIPVASTAYVAVAKESFCGGANGQALMTKFDSTGEGESGGVVLRFTIIDEEQSRIPYAVNIPGGTEIHLAGETEARAMLTALRRIITEL